jgi:hypothetical protein
MTELTRFPFGRPNTVRPPQRSEQPCRVLVVGAYPSAFHVRWKAPACLHPQDSAGWTGTVRAIAVDVEPKVFWEGAKDAERRESLLSEWMAGVGFVKGRDLDAEHEAFLAPHSFEIVVDEIFHLDPFGEETELLRLSADAAESYTVEGDDDRDDE